jgi:hypothetical protein
VRREYDAGPGDIAALLNSAADTKIWFPRPQVGLPESAEIPSPPAEEDPPWPRERHTEYFDQAEVYPPEVGDGRALNRLIGLIANGWNGNGSLAVPRRSPPI